MNQKRTTERGQAMIITVVAVVALLGFIALAVDGGMIYSERRSSQNAADAAAMAGAMAKANGEDFYSAAVAVAEGHGYAADDPDRTVEVFNPPVGGRFDGNAEYVQVILTTRIKTAWVHFVYQGVTENTSVAVARVQPAVVDQAWLDGHAIIGLKTSGKRVVQASGNNETTVQGTIFSNSNDGDEALYGGGSSTVNVTDGVFAVGGISISKPGEIASYNESQTAMAYPPEPPFGLPACSGNAVWDAATKTLSPGKITMNNLPNLGGETAYFGDPEDESTKIYCVDGKNFTINSGDVVVGHNVLFYVKSGAFSINGGASVELDAPDEGEWAGLLVYQNIANTAKLTINGNSDSTFVGTLYAPGAEIQINGDSGTGVINSQVIGLIVDLSGNSDLLVIYNPTDNVNIDIPPLVELTE